MERAESNWAMVREYITLRRWAAGRPGGKYILDTFDDAVNVAYVARTWPYRLCEQPRPIPDGPLDFRNVVE